MKNVIVLILLLLTACASQPVHENAGSSSMRILYSDLVLRDLDEMTALVKSKIVQSRQSTDDKVAPLKDALRAVYSRPDEDGMIEKVIGPLRTELDEQDAWERAFTEIVDDCIATLKNPEGIKPSVQVTDATFLQNAVAQMKPKARDDGFERAMVEHIRDAKIELTPEMRNERRLRLMKESVSPSTLAAQVVGPAS